MNFQMLTDPRLPPSSKADRHVHAVRAQPPRPIRHACHAPAIIGALAGRYQTCANNRRKAGMARSSAARSPCSSRSSPASSRPNNAPRTEAVTARPSSVRTSCMRRREAIHKLFLVCLPDVLDSSSCFPPAHATCPDGRRTRGDGLGPWRIVRPARGRARTARSWRPRRAGSGHACLAAVVRTGLIPPCQSADYCRRVASVPDWAWRLRTDSMHMRISLAAGRQARIGQHLELMRSAPLTNPAIVVVP